MGQKVSPIGMRVGVIRDWDSRWYANKADFGDLLNEDVKVRNFLEKELKDAYISRVEIERTSKKDVKVIVRCARPGAMLGKDGDKDKMEVLKKKLSKLTGGKNVKVDVIAVANPDLDARLVARRICEQLEARQSFRKFFRDKWLRNQRLLAVQQEMTAETTTDVVAVMTESQQAIALHVLLK